MLPILVLRLGVTDLRQYEGTEGSSCVIPEKVHPRLLRPRSTFTERIPYPTEVESDQSGDAPGTRNSDSRQPTRVPHRSPRPRSRPVSPVSTTQDRTPGHTCLEVTKTGGSTSSSSTTLSGCRGRGDTGASREWTPPHVTPPPRDPPTSGEDLSTLGTGPSPQSYRT